MGSGDQRRIAAKGGDPVIGRQLQQDIGVRKPTRKLESPDFLTGSMVSGCWAWLLNTGDGIARKESERAKKTKAPPDAFFHLFIG